MTLPTNYLKFLWATDCDFRVRDLSTKYPFMHHTVKVSKRKNNFSFSS